VRRSSVWVFKEGRPVLLLADIKLNKKGCEVRRKREGEEDELDGNKKKMLYKISK
jgi:hypothetical protein